MLNGNKIVEERLAAMNLPIALNGHTTREILVSLVTPKKQKKIEMVITFAISNRDEQQIELFTTTEFVVSSKPKYSEKVFETFSNVNDAIERYESL